MQYLIAGLANGACYALLALGLVIILKATDVPNFALAEMGLLPAFVVWYLIADASVSYWLAVVIGLAFAFCIGMAIEWLAIQPLIGLPHAVTNIMSIGLWFSVNAVTSLVFGLTPVTVTPPYSGLLRIGGVVAEWTDVVALLVGVALAVGLSLFFRTRWGLYMRAVASNPQVARLLGIRLGLLASLVWGAAASVAMIGVLLYAQTTQLSVDTGSNLIFNAFVAATIAGFSSVRMAFVGGLALGVVEEIVGAFTGSAWELAVGMAVILVVLVIRPRGFGGATEVREV